MKLKLFILILALQSAWVLYPVAVHERPLATGKVITLETAPVDPRDLLRGDYLILSYQISNVPINLFSPPVKRGLPEGTTVFIALKPRGEFFAVAAAGTNKFKPPADGVLLKARCAGQTWNNSRAVRVEYGLERFYVREGTGDPRGKLTVQAVVPASGRASIKQVFLDGKPYAEAMKEDAH